MTYRVQRALSGHDACALIAHVAPVGGRRGLERVLAGLQAMEHRCGRVAGEGDGVGVHLDLPRGLWAGRVGEAAAQLPGFAVAHLFLPSGQAEVVATAATVGRATGILGLHGAKVLDRVVGCVRPSALGPIAARREPQFLQLALAIEGPEPDQRLFEAHLALETAGIHVASLSRHHVVYKVHGGVDTLVGYYPDLADPRLVSAITLGHSRFSTNTLPSFERVQPAALLGHNGEINTIDRLRREARLLDIPLVPGGSDSQDLDRVLHALVTRYGLSLFEAMEVVFPPVANGLPSMGRAEEQAYRFMRHFWGPYAQGPAGIMARWRDAVCFATDALGLRPLWLLETAEGYYITSERVAVPFDLLDADPRPLAPGEKIGMTVERGKTVAVVEHQAIRERAVRRFSASGVTLGAGVPPAATWSNQIEPTLVTPACFSLDRDRRLAGFGFCLDDLEFLSTLAATGAEPIGSLGYDGPLAALFPKGKALADFAKESVAVVTNPAMDREREAEHFSTEWELGPRPGLDTPADPPFTVALPILPDLAACEGFVGSGALDAVAARTGSLRLETVMARFRTSVLDLTHPDGGSARERLAALGAVAVRTVRSGVELLVLDDADTLSCCRIALDPHLALAWIDRALAESGLRRRCSLILRSGGLRNLHDLVLAFAIGADAVAPYLLLETAVMAGTAGPGPGDAPGAAPCDAATLRDPAARLANTLAALGKGLQKVISTMGTHELRGYGRCFATIGVGPELSALLGVRDFGGTERSGLTIERLEAEARRRHALAIGQGPVRVPRDRRFYPFVWKAAGQVAAGQAEYGAFAARVREEECQAPVALRHLLAIHAPASPHVVRPADVDTRVDIHEYPLAISSMSFGSQGEVAFRSYVEAARRLDIVCMNGEGGEIPELIGRYRRHRGQQVASGRFGVSAETLNSAYVIEIKIGQGAKPGEGGHLPGKKVSAKVARARNAAPGIDLISPSNNHDIYSIEDLAQLVEELKQVNPFAKVSVKVPVVPNIGTIAVGIAKAGADFITLSGFDGGTGAARTHALKHVGLPVEIGVKEAHRALSLAGLRHLVEIWADGGLKTGQDVVRLLLLGANRCGFGTMAMVAAGCTICRGCQADTCHVGIATQIADEDEARTKGLKRFVPREHEQAVAHLCTLFHAIGEEVRAITAQLGFRRTQDLVGRADLLRQVAGQDRVDLSELLDPLPLMPGLLAVARDAGTRARVRRQRRQAARAATNARSWQSTEVLAEADGGTGAAQPSSGRWNSQDRAGAALALAAEVGAARIPAGGTGRALGTDLAGSSVRWNLYGRRKSHSAHAPGELHGHVHGHVHGHGQGHRHSHRNGHLHDRQKVNGTRLWEASRGIPAAADGPPEAGPIHIRGAVAGNGCAAFGHADLAMRIEGGAQDGAAKCAIGGRLAIVKGRTASGRLVDGAVGKGFAYGAQRGLLLVQGVADSRFCIRLSGARVVAGARLSEPIDDSAGPQAGRAHLKGFAFEYMTAGVAVVLGDPGPWLCAGMTGGAVYVRLWPEFGFDPEALVRRLAKGAGVVLRPVGTRDVEILTELLEEYRRELEAVGQCDEAAAIAAISASAPESFVAIRPASRQVDQEISTE